MIGRLEDPKGIIAIRAESLEFTETLAGRMGPHRARRMDRMRPNSREAGIHFELDGFLAKKLGRDDSKCANDLPRGMPLVGPAPECDALVKRPRRPSLTMGQRRGAP